jgi:hypothetical protein
MSNENMEILFDMKKHLKYDPKTGVIKYATKRGPKEPGDICGRVYKGYVRIQYSNKWFQGHRVAWALYHGVWPQGTVDHKNRINHDNRISNLRDVPQWVNNHNKGRYPNKLGLRGVCYKSNLYYTRITYKGKVKSLGYFKCPIKAAKAYDVEAKRLFGEFATLNFPD